RWRTTQPPGDAPHRLPRSPRQRDLLTLGKRQVAALQIPAAARTHPARRRHPPRALLAICPDLRRCVGDELTPLQRRPERLNLLIDHALSKDSHQHLNRRGVATTARTQACGNGRLLLFAAERDAGGPL